jgi:hypothetical protein
MSRVSRHTDETLCAIIPTMTAREAAERLGYDPGAIYWHAKRLRLRCKPAKRGRPFKEGSR